MDLHAFVTGAISAINPSEQLTIRISTGNTINADGTIAPSYAAALTIPGQKQALSQSEIARMDAMNIQGMRVRIYINGRIDGLIRAANKGGDLITDAAGNVWLVNEVLETWPDWCAVSAILQDGV